MCGTERPQLTAYSTHKHLITSTKHAFVQGIKHINNDTIGPGHTLTLTVAQWGCFNFPFNNSYQKAGYACTDIALLIRGTMFMI